MKTLTYSLTLLLVLAAASVFGANNGGKYVIYADGAVSTTSVIGYSSGTKQTYMGYPVVNTTNLRPVALKGLGLAERSDKPCSLEVTMGALPEHASNTVGALTKKVAVSPCSSNQSGSKSALFTGGAKFVRGVKICTSSSRRIKAITVYPAKVGNYGTVENGTKTKAFKRTNCNNWHDAVYCPANQVATGVVGHFTTDGYTGLQLKCQAITRKWLNTN